jgi:hypothetical protein
MVSGGLGLWEGYEKVGTHRESHVTLNSATEVSISFLDFKVCHS